MKDDRTGTDAPSDADLPGERAADAPVPSGTAESERPSGPTARPMRRRGKPGRISTTRPDDQPSDEGDRSQGPAGSDGRRSPEDTGAAGEAGSGAEAAVAGSGGWGRWVQVALLVVPALVLLERGWDRRWMTDDGFINLRVVRMVVEGHGPVFNVGERVEVTTSTAWLWLLTLGDVLLPLRLEWVAIVLGLAGAVGGLLLATFGAGRLHRGMGATGVLVPVGALVVAAVSPVWDFSTSGIEGGLTFGWLGLCGFLLARWATADRRLGLVSAVVLGFGPLVRPDLLLVAAVLVVGVLAADWRTSSWGDRLRVVGAAVALPAAYEVFRMGYYGSLVPNPALAKSASRGRWGTGFDYLRDFVQPYWLVLPLLVLIGAVLLPAVRHAWRSDDRRAAVALAALPVAGLLDGLYIVRVGGDYMHGRLLLPAFFALTVPLAAVPLPIRPSRPSRESHESREGPRWGMGMAGTVAAGVAAAWALLVLGWVRPSETPVVDGLFSSDARQGAVRLYGEHPVTTSDQGWGPGGTMGRLDPEVALYTDGRPLDARPGRGLRTPAYAGWGIGIAGYVLGPDVHIIDMLGLGDPVASRFVLDHPRSVGHEKPMPRPWLAARMIAGTVDPDRLPSPAMTEPLYESDPDEFDADVAAARRALGCGDLRRLDEAVSDPMSPGRFLSNLVAAPRQTRLEVPPDPHAAAERFCD